MTDDPGSLAGFLALAASVGVVHTLVGPDHYLLIGAWAKVRKAGWRVVMSFTLLAGLLHCATSAIVVFASLWLLDGSAALLGLETLRGDILAWALVAIGIAWAISGWRRRHAAPDDAQPPMRPWLLALFALGPCEWLLPNALAASASHGWQGAALVIAVFTFATVATMLVCVAATVKLPVPRKLVGPMMPGIVTFACGLMVLIGL